MNRNLPAVVGVSSAAASALCLKLHQPELAASCLTASVAAAAAAVIQNCRGNESLCCQPKCCPSITQRACKLLTTITSPGWSGLMALATPLRSVIDLNSPIARIIGPSVVGCHVESVVRSILNNELPEFTSSFPKTMWLASSSISGAAGIISSTLMAQAFGWERESLLKEMIGSKSHLVGLALSGLLISTIIQCSSSVFSRLGKPHEETTKVKPNVDTGEISPERTPSISFIEESAVGPGTPSDNELARRVTTRLAFEGGVGQEQQGSGPTQIDSTRSRPGLMRLAPSANLAEDLASGQSVEVAAISPSSSKIPSAPPLGRSLSQSSSVPPAPPAPPIPQPLAPALPPALPPGQSLGPAAPALPLAPAPAVPPSSSAVAVNLKSMLGGDALIIGISSLRRTSLPAVANPAQSSSKAAAVGQPNFAEEIKKIQQVKALRKLSGVVQASGSSTPRARGDDGNDWDTSDQLGRVLSGQQLKLKQAQGIAQIEREKQERLAVIRAFISPPDTEPDASPMKDGGSLSPVKISETGSKASRSLDFDPNKSKTAPLVGIVPHSSSTGPVVPSGQPNKGGVAKKFDPPVRTPAASSAIKPQAAAVNPALAPVQQEQQEQQEQLTDQSTEGRSLNIAERKELLQQKASGGLKFER